MDRAVALSEVAAGAISGPWDFHVADPSWHSLRLRHSNHQTVARRHEPNHHNLGCLNPDTFGRDPHATHRPFCEFMQRLQTQSLFEIQNGTLKSSSGSTVPHSSTDDQPFTRVKLYHSRPTTDIADALDWPELSNSSNDVVRRPSLPYASARCVVHECTTSASIGSGTPL